MLRKIDLPPVWTVFFLLVAFLAPRYFPLYSFNSRPTDLIGYGLIAIGLGLAAWTAVWFFKKKTPIEPRHNPKALIIEGPFRINRNPIYTGMFLCLVGSALALGAISSVMAVLPFPFLITNRFIQGEEEALRKTFGDEADDYIARSRRW